MFPRAMARGWGSESREGSEERGPFVYHLQGVVGLEVTVVQTGVLGFLASSSANFHVQHVFQAFHYLKRAEGRAWVTLFNPAEGGFRAGGERALMGLVPPCPLERE